MDRAAFAQVPRNVSLAAGDSWKVVQERLRKKFDSRH